MPIIRNIKKDLIVDPIKSDVVVGGKPQGENLIDNLNKIPLIHDEIDHVNDTEGDDDHPDFMADFLCCLKNVEDNFDTMKFSDVSIIIRELENLLKLINNFKYK
nr:MAG: hypothetical protein [Cressdnaviricota sp.]